MPETIQNTNTTECAHGARPEEPFAAIREVVWMAFPIFLTTVSYTVMTFVDQAFVGRLGKPQLAAVGMAGVWVFTILSFLIGMVGAVATFVSQSLGRGDKESCARYAWQGIYLSVLAAGVTLVFLPGAEWLFRLMGHEPEVLQYEGPYFRIRMYGCFFMAAQWALTSFFQGVSRQKVPMFTAFAANIVNIVLDYLLIFGAFGFPELGVAGAAWATVAAQALQFAMLAGVFLSAGYDTEFGTRTGWRFDWRRTREISRIGSPAGLSLFLDIFNWAVFTGFIVGGFGGPTAMAAHTVTMAFLQVSFMPCLGVMHAVTALVGQWIGRGDIPAAKARAYAGLRLAIPYMTVVGLVFAVFGPHLTRVVFDADPAVVSMAHVLLIIAAVFQAFDAVNIIMIGGLRGTGDTKYLMWAFLIVGYGFFLPLAFGLAFLLPNPAIGAWVAACAYIIVLSGVLLQRFHREKWREIRIFDADQPPAAGVAAAPEAFAQEPARAGVTEAARPECP